jgi:hypothetical protein
MRETFDDLGLGLGEGDDSRQPKPSLVNVRFVTARMREAQTRRIRKKH